MKKRNALLLSFSLLFFALPQPVQAAKKEIVKVATDSATKPFTYKVKNKATGYDIEVLKQVFKRSKYTLKVETVSFPSILTGIDAGRYQIAANNFGYSKKRAKKYLFSSPISKSPYVLATKKNKRYRKLDDLSGKTTTGMPGANYVQVLEKWNQNHPDQKPIKIHYAAGSSPLSQRLQQLESGQLDFMFYDAISLKTAIKEHGLSLKITKLEQEDNEQRDGLSYYIFADDKKGKALQAFVNKRLRKLQKTGKLKKLSRKFFDGDFVPTSR
ncbi:transporter substrate-binding domain-containing protein [Streptococcus phocae subsp. phocae]